MRSSAVIQSPLWETMRCHMAHVRLMRCGRAIAGRSGTQAWGWRACRSAGEEVSMPYLIQSTAVRACNPANTHRPCLGPGSGIRRCRTCSAQTDLLTIAADCTHRACWLPPPTAMPSKAAHPQGSQTDKVRDAASTGACMRRWLP